MTDWTPEQIAEAKFLWSQGWTAVNIGLHLDKTKGQVIGKQWRGHWSRDHRVKPPIAHAPSAKLPPPINHAKQEASRLRNEGLDQDEIAQALKVSLRQSRSVRTHTPRTRHAMMQEPVSAPTCSPVTLLERRNDQCAWPVGDTYGSNLLMCGAPVARRSYCQHHLLLGWTPVQDRKRWDRALGMRP